MKQRLAKYRIADGTKYWIAYASLFVASLSASANAQNATWLTTPVNSQFQNGANWTGGVVPTGTASFGVSQQTDVDVETIVTLETMRFTPGADQFSYWLIGVNRRINFVGNGIVNDSSSVPYFYMNMGSISTAVAFSNYSQAGNAYLHLNQFNAGQPGILFTGASSAAQSLIHIYGQAEHNGPWVEFRDQSTAADAEFLLTGTSEARFYDDTTAANAYIEITNERSGVRFDGNATAANAIVNGSSDGGNIAFYGNASAGQVQVMGAPCGENECFGMSAVFYDASTAENATIEANECAFGGNSNADNATIAAYGIMAVAESASLGQASITSHEAMWIAHFASTGQSTIDFSGVMDISFMDIASLDFWTLTGDGDIYLGDRMIRPGGSGIDVTLGGVIQDGSTIEPPGAVGGSLEKIGAGVLTLTAANTYTGSTNALEGSLYINGSVASAANRALTGGTLGGSGVIGGGVSVRTGGTLDPGSAPGGVGTLTVVSQSEFRNGAIYVVDLRDAQGAPGSGWDLLVLNSSMNFTSTPATTIRLRSQDAMTGLPGPADGFNGATPYSWLIIDGSASGAGNQYPNFNPAAFTIDAGEFANTFNGSFSVRRNDRLIYLDYIPTPTLLGDMNCDGFVDLDDVEPFVLALLDADAYAAAYLTCDIAHGDTNQDAAVNGLDTQGFVNAVLGN